MNNISKDLSNARINWESLQAMLRSKSPSALPKSSYLQLISAHPNARELNRRRIKTFAFMFYSNYDVLPFQISSTTILLIESCVVCRWSVEICWIAHQMKKSMTSTINSSLSYAGMGSVLFYVTLSRLIYKLIVAKFRPSCQYLDFNRKPRHTLTVVCLQPFAFRCRPGIISVVLVPARRSHPERIVNMSRSLKYSFTVCICYVVFFICVFGNKIKNYAVRFTLHYVYSIVFTGRPGPARFGRESIWFPKVRFLPAANHSQIVCTFSTGEISVITIFTLLRIVEMRY